MVNVEQHENGSHVAWVSPMVALFNRQQLAMGCGRGCEPDNVVTESGWYADELGPFADRGEACSAVGIDPDDDTWEYAN